MPGTSKRNSSGSSPRVRGTRVFFVGLTLIMRFIPARAGNASVCPTPPVNFPVHPRACGERGAPLRLQIVVVGSSPRVRGTRRPAGSPTRYRRFIPARAGNAATWGSFIMRLAVHPRACGERGDIGEFTDSCNGSSPRVRGTRLPAENPPMHQRFIPARAGNALAVSA